MVTFQIIFPEIAFSFNMNMGIVHFKLFLKRDMRGIPWVKLEDDAMEFVAFLLVVVCCSRRLHGVAAEGHFVAHAPRKFVRRVRRHFDIFSALLPVFN